MTFEDDAVSLDFAVLLDRLPIGTMVWHQPSSGPDRRLKLAYCNQHARRTLGLSPEDLDDATPKRLFSRVPHDQFVAIAAAYARLPDSGVAEIGDATIVEADGSQRVFSLLGFRIDADTAGTLFTDVTEERRAQAALRQSEVRFRSLVAEVPVGLAIIGPAPAADLKESNKALRRLLGYGEAQLIDTVSLMAHLIEPMVRERLARPGEGRFVAETEAQLRRQDGGHGWVSLSAAPLADGSEDMVVAMVDITARKEAQAQYQYLAFHDPLTGLPNRTLLLDRLEQALCRLPWHDRLLAVLYLDLDLFKPINDSLGHEAGDHLLKAVAERLRASVRPGDTVARMSGDEFVVVLRDLATESDVIALAERIKDHVLEPVPWGEKETMQVGVSAGIAIAPTDGAEAAMLLRHADTAMYEAKSAGRGGYRFFSRSMNERLSTRLRTQTGLRSALEKKEFELHYQPIVCVADGRISGLEALLRWQRSELGMVLPGEFISLAEETGLIIDIGHWVIESACRQVREWLDRGLLEVPVSVNLSARQFQDPDLVPWFTDCLSSFGVPAGNVRVEITESNVIVDTRRALSVLDEFNRLGVGVAVDDFGTGHSSLAQLKRLPVDALKIDISFVRDIATDPADAAIVEATVAMARKLGLKTIAEGVETEAQLLQVIHAGCDEAQGFYYARPMPAAALGGLLSARRAGP